MSLNRAEIKTFQVIHEEFLKLNDVEKLSQVKNSLELLARDGIPFRNYEEKMEYINNIRTPLYDFYLLEDIVKFEFDLQQKLFDILFILAFHWPLNTNCCIKRTAEVVAVQDRAILISGHIVERYALEHYLNNNSERPPHPYISDKHVTVREILYNLPNFLRTEQEFVFYPKPLKKKFRNIAANIDLWDYSFFAGTAIAFFSFFAFVTLPIIPTILVDSLLPSIAFFGLTFIGSMILAGVVIYGARKAFDIYMANQMYSAVEFHSEHITKSTNTQYIKTLAYMNVSLKILLDHIDILRSNVHENASQRIPSNNLNIEQRLSTDKDSTKLVRSQSIDWSKSLLGKSKTKEDKISISDFKSDQISATVTSRI